MVTHVKEDPEEILKDEEAAARDYSKPVVILLKHPVKFAGQEILEVTLQPLTGRHLRGISGKSSLDELMRVAAKASGLSDKVFDLMRAADIMAITEAVGEAL